MYNKIGGRIFFLGAVTQSEYVNVESLKNNVYRQRTVLFEHIMEQNTTFNVKKLTIYRNNLSLIKRVRTTLAELCECTGNCMEMTEFDSFISHYDPDIDAAEHIDSDNIRCDPYIKQSESTCDAVEYPSNINILSMIITMLFGVIIGIVVRPLITKFVDPETTRNHPDTASNHDDYQNAMDRSNAGDSKGNGEALKNTDRAQANRLQDMDQSATLNKVIVNKKGRRKRTKKRVQIEGEEEQSAVSIVKQQDFQDSVILNVITDEP